MEGGLAAFVRQRRGELGLTQRELAARVGTTPAYISQIETGDPKWPQTLVPALAKALGVSQVELALAAGVITEASTARAEPFPAGDVRRKIAALLSELRDDDAELVRIVVAAAVERRRSIGAEERLGVPGDTAQAGAVGIAQGKARLLAVDPCEDEAPEIAIV